MNFYWKLDLDNRIRYVRILREIVKYKVVK